jgi:hypothetical protein
MVANMARPAEWRGSDLRTRAEVVQYLSDRGGVLEDEKGYAGKQMQADLGKGRALVQLLGDMEKDGMISREIRGRRTYMIKLVDDWGLAARRLRPVPSPTQQQPSDGDVLRNLSGADLDYDQLGAAMLREAARILASPASGKSDTQAQSVLTGRLKRAEAALQKTNEQMRELREAKRAAEERATEAERQARALESNIERLQREIDKPRRSKDSGGVSIAERLSAKERAELAALMRELPETATSKPRPAKRTR